MQMKENDDPQNYKSKYLDIVNIPISKIEIKNHWCPNLEKELIAKVRPITKVKKTDDYEHKYLCLSIGVISLLSIGFCVQADCIAQSLREIVMFSAQETIRVNNQ